MILIIDNYDSFTYNLYQICGVLSNDPIVVRNDEQFKNIEKLKPTHIIISPGPKTPREAGISNQVIKDFAGRVPILGVCLGHQCIAYTFGGKVCRATRIMHGKTSFIFHDNKGVYKNLPNPFVAMRYHSLIVDKNTLPKELIPTSWTEKNELMGLRHLKYPLEGIQFHPESFKTEVGKELIRNFLNL